IPYAALIQATDGSFYGTTILGGDTTACPGGNGVFGYVPSGCGTVFRMTPTGTVTVVHAFTGASGTDGTGNPHAALTQAPDGNLYGTTPNTVFKMTPNGIVTVLHNFNLWDGL